MSSPQNLVLTTKTRGHATVITVDGELDLSTVGSLEEHLESFPSWTAIVLTDCTFIDSSALRSLVRAERHAREAGQGLVLVAPSQTVLRVLEIAGLDRVLPVVATVEDAITSPS